MERIKEYPLVSVIVLCYKNFQYIYEAIASVLSQEYPKLELLISDDGSSDFPKEELDAYVQMHRRENIISVKFNHNEKNIGTVKHLNRAVGLTTGEYVMSLSADDVIEDSAGVMRYVEGLEARSDADILMAQTAMYNEDMDELQYYFVQPHIRDLLLGKQNDDQLLNELVQHAYLPSVSTFFKKTFFEKYGKFDESYDLVEDWSLHLRLAREHIPIVYLDFPSIRHRSGGVSHGNTAGTNSTYYRYLCDLNRTYENDVAPYLDRVDPEVREKVKFRHKQDAAWTDFHYRDKKNGLIGIIHYGCSHPAIVFQRMAKVVYHQCSGRAWHPLLFAVLLLFLMPGITEAISICASIVGIAAKVSVAVCSILYGVGYVLGIFGILFVPLYICSAVYCCITEYISLYF